MASSTAGLIVDGGQTKRGRHPSAARAACRFRRTGRSWSCGRPARADCTGPMSTGPSPTCHPITQDVTDSLCRLVLLEILPAVIERDLAAFGAALSELQATRGRLFRAGSRGIYSTDTGAADRRRSCGPLGFVGVGQSSWGPTLYAFSPQSQPRTRIDGRSESASDSASIAGRLVYFGPRGVPTREPGRSLRATEGAIT